jgi:hypothetical protein
MGQNEFPPADQVRGLGQQHVAFAERFPDQPKFVMFQIPKPAVD